MLVLWLGFSVQVALVPLGLLIAWCVVALFREPWRDSLIILSVGIAFASFAYWADRNLPSWWFFAAVPALLGAIWLLTWWRRAAPPADNSVA